MSREKRGPGRPPMPEGAAKATMFAIRLTPAERAAIDAAAERAGKGVSQWAREALIAAARGL